MLKLSMVSAPFYIILLHNLSKGGFIPVKIKIKCEIILTEINSLILLKILKMFYLWFSYLTVVVPVYLCIVSSGIKAQHTRYEGKLFCSVFNTVSNSDWAIPPHILQKKLYI